MNKNKLLKAMVLAGTCLLTGLLGAQTVGMNYWAVPPNTYKMNQVSPAVTAMSYSPPSSCGESNGAYDDSGNLIFYVYGDVAGNGAIVDAAGNSVMLPGFVTGPPGPWEQDYMMCGPEISVVPVPGQCKKYYVIYYLMSASGSGGGGIAHVYVTVDCNTSTMSVSSLTIINSNSKGGIAVSKLSGSVRYLFISDGANIIRYTISSGGIGSATTIANQSVIPGASLNDIQELILSPNQLYLAWPVRFSSSTIGQINLNSSYTYSGSNYTYSIPTSGGNTVSGLEFNSTSTKLFACSGNGLYYLTPGATPAITSISGTSSMTGTQLRLNYNGIIGASNSGILFRINPSTFAVTTSICTTAVTSAAAYPWKALYTLPDQIEGEAYAHFSGVPLATCAFKVNNTTVWCYGDEGTIPAEVYNCNPIVLNNLCTNATTYTVELQSTDMYESPISGTGLLGTYNSGALGSCPTDLRSLPGTNGTWLATHDGWYNVTLTVDNGCGLTKTACGFIHVNNSPGAVSINLRINNGITGISCMTKSLPGCPTGEYSASYNLGGSSTSTMSYYRIVIDEVNCSTGALVGNVYTGTNVAYTGQALTGLALNALVIGGSTGYFTTKLNHCYKLTAYVGNVCGEASDWSYLKIDGAYRMANPNAETTDATLSVYPNPNGGQFTVDYVLNENDNAVFELFDVRGVLVASYKLNAADNQLIISNEELSNGVYVYKLSANGGSLQTGRLVIAK